MYILQLYLPLTNTLNPPSWEVVANSMSSFWNTFNVQRGYIPGALYDLLPALTYSRWYNILHVVLLVTQCPRGLPDTAPISEVLAQQRSATQSAALSPMIGGASMCLSVMLLVNNFQCWLVRKGENNLRCKTFLYSTIEMTVS